MKMTNEQTLEQFLNVLNTNAYLDIFECSDMKNAISALEKQIPKKPIIKKLKLTDFQDFYCPSCNKRIISRIDGEWIVGRLQKYCDDCGQALEF